MENEIDLNNKKRSSDVNERILEELKRISKIQMMIFNEQKKQTNLSNRINNTLIELREWEMN